MLLAILDLIKTKNGLATVLENNQYDYRLKDAEHLLHEVQQNNAALKTNYEELQKKYDSLVKANDIKDKLIPMLAHDIRSPLASLQNTISLTRENIINPEEFDKLSSALEADVFNLRGMLDNMFFWAKEQMLETKIRKEEFNISETVRDTILMYRHNLDMKNIGLHNNVPQQLLVSTDKEIISAVFRNLFSNAVKFSDPGKNIYVNQIFFKGKVLISIKNDGKPITPELLQKLNNKEHISTRGTANEKGTGLGLIFCREMLGKLEETFDIASYPNQGTSVTFSINVN